MGRAAVAVVFGPEVREGPLVEHGGSVKRQGKRPPRRDRSEHLHVRDGRKWYTSPVFHQKREHAGEKGDLMANRQGEPFTHYTRR